MSFKAERVVGFRHEAGSSDCGSGRNRYVLFSCCGGCLLTNGTVNRVSNINRARRDNRKTPEFCKMLKLLA